MKQKNRLSKIAMVLAVLLFSAFLSGCGMLAFVTATETHEIAKISVVLEPDSANKQGVSNFEVTPKLGVYALNTNAITVEITNTSENDGGFSRNYRIEKRTDEGWMTLPFEIIVTSEWMILPAGETKEHTYSLQKGLLHYSPDTEYRIVMLGVAGEPSVGFILSAFNDSIRDMTLFDAKALAQNIGTDLHIDDLEGFNGFEVGSGLYIMQYEMTDSDYVLLVGSDNTTDVLYAYLLPYSGAEADEGIDIRHYDVEKFIADGTKELVNPLPSAE